MTWRPPNDLERFLLADTRERWPEVLPLARLLVLAPRIEPLLLRNSRYRYLPAQGAELESQLWFSPLVAARSTREIVLHLGVARVLAGQLGGAEPGPSGDGLEDGQEDGDTPSLDEVWALTCEHTRHWPPEDRLERDLRYHALRGADVGLAGGLQAILARVADETTGEEDRIRLARLAKRILPSLGPAFGERSAATARLLARYAALALGDGGGWSARSLGDPEALPPWLADRLPPPLAEAHLAVEVRADDGERQVLHLVAPADASTAIELPSPLPGRLHVAPAGRVGAWHPVNRGSRIAIEPPSAAVRLSTLNGSQWELTTELPEGVAAAARPEPLLLVHAEADREQAASIADWLRGQGIAVEPLAEAPGRRQETGATPARVVRLWTRAARDLWAPSEVEPADEADARRLDGLLLRIESVDLPASGPAAGRRLDWLDWKRLAESPYAAALAEALGSWWREGQLPPAAPEAGPLPRDASGAGAAAGTAAAPRGSPGADADAAREAEIARLLAEIADPKTEPPRRLAIGDRLADLDDPRPGVGIVEIEAPVDGPPEADEPAADKAGMPAASYPPEIQALLDELADSNTTPPRRLEIGDELDRLGDPRPGVGLTGDGLPDVDWVEIPGGPFVYQDGETRELPDFWVARYPVTNAQYQAFIDDGGYKDRRWWQDLKRPKPEDSRWLQKNRPRTNVDWYECVAFARWLNARLGLSEGSIRLPSELEWEKAARGEQGRMFPWGNEYRSGYANVNETRGEQGQWNLGQTTAVGVYPHGASPYAVEDLAGNVWEWCLNKSDDLEVIAPDRSSASRALRGLSWITAPDLARADLRRWSPPESRLDHWGFRLLSSVPIGAVRCRSPADHIGAGGQPRSPHKGLQDMPAQAPAVGMAHMGDPALHACVELAEADPPLAPGVEACPQATGRLHLSGMSERTARTSASMASIFAMSSMASPTLTD